MSRVGEDVVQAVLNNLHGRKGVGNELEAIDEDIYEEMKTDLIAAVDATLKERGYMSEQQHANDQVRRLRADGRCPTCGAEEGPHNRL